MALSFCFDAFSHVGHHGATWNIAFSGRPAEVAIKARLCHVLPRFAVPRVIRGLLPFYSLVEIQRDF